MCKQDRLEGPKVKVTNDNYPVWSCGDCASEAGGQWPKGHLGTFHSNYCPVCGNKRAVTSPRDWGYPKYKEVLDPKYWKDVNEEVDDGTDDSL